MHVWFTADGSLAESLAILPGQEGWQACKGLLQGHLTLASLFFLRDCHETGSHPLPLCRGGMGLSASPLEIERQDVRTLNCSSELAHQEKVIPQVTLQLSGPSCFKCGALLVCSRKMLGCWHLWLTRLFTAHGSNKLSATKVAPCIFSHWISQTWALNLTCLVCAWELCLFTKEGRL